jgi:hypothetical protein
VEAAVRVAATHFLGWGAAGLQSSRSLHFWSNREVFVSHPRMFGTECMPIYTGGVKYTD